MPQRWLISWGLTAIAFGGASLIVPLYVVELGGTAFTLGVLFASASFVGIPGALVFGTLADRTGRLRLFVLLAMATTTATMGAIPFVGGILPVIVANALLWLGFAAATPVVTLLVVAEVPEDRWSELIAKLNKYQGIGWALGLAVGFVVIAAGSQVAPAIAAQRAFFFVCSICAALGFAGGLRTLPADPPRDAQPTRDKLQRFTRRASRFNIRGASFPFAPGRVDYRDFHPARFLERFPPQLATYFLAVFLLFTGFGIFFAPLPAYLSDVGHGSDTIFGLYLALNIGAAVFYGQAGRLADIYGLTRTHVGSLLVRAAAFPAVAVVGLLLGGTLFGTGVTTAIFFVIGMTWAVIAVTAATLVTKLTPVVIRGESLGIYAALVALGGGVGGLLGGMLVVLEYTVVFGIAGGIVLLGIVVIAAIQRSPTG